MAEISYKDTARRCVVLRKAFKSTQEAIAAIGGVGKTAWTNFEKSDERLITIHVANRMCDSFGVTLDWIYRGDLSGLSNALIDKIAAAEAELNRPSVRPPSVKLRASKARNVVPNRRQTPRRGAV